MTTTFQKRHDHKLQMNNFPTNSKALDSTPSSHPHFRSPTTQTSSPRFTYQQTPMESCHQTTLRSRSWGTAVSSSSVRSK